MKVIVLVLLITFCSVVVQSAKILVMHPLQGGSHRIQLGILSEELIKRGHQVETVSFMNAGDNVEALTRNKLHYLLTIENVDGRYPYISQEETGQFEFPNRLFWSGGDNPHNLPWDAFKTTEALCETLLLKNPKLYDHLQSVKFDVAIVDLVSNECGLAYAYSLGVKVILGYWAMFAVGGEIDYIPSSTLPSYVPSFLSRNRDVMDFWDRLYNLYLKAASHLVMQIQFYLANSYVQKRFPRTPHPSLLLANLSGILINSDYSLDYAKLLPPNALNVGCMQCRDSQPLPKNLQEFIESSEAGIILFSMGALFDASIASELIPKLFKAFSKLPQKVLVKIKRQRQTNDFIDCHIPSNVMLADWLPQQDILGHPKTKLFFTHCGLHSVFEAIWHGVPMVGMPVYGDQFDVLVRLEEKGIGVGLTKESSELEIYEAVQTVLSNSSYTKNVRRVQNLLIDNPHHDHPMERAIRHIETLHRLGNGGEHLKPSSRYFTYIQLYSLDSLLFIFIVFLLIFLLPRLVLKITIYASRKVILYLKSFEKEVREKLE